VRQVQYPFEREFGEILQRLDRHSKVVDKTAVAVEMLKASEYRKRQEHADQAALKLQIESWMKAANMRVVHEAQVKNKLHGTCEWIWNNNVFQEWANLSSWTPSDRLLIVHGTHGCGKSTLASAIVSHYRSQAKRCLFFAFSGSDRCRQTSESLIRSCLWQMLQYAPESNVLEILTQLMAKHEPLEDDFWNAMSMISGQDPVWIVIDGLDESLGSCDVLIQRLIELLTQKPKLRAISLGRSYVLTRTIHDIQFSVEMSSGFTKQDIDAYITAGVLKDALLSKNDLKDTISDTLKKKAGGMFLWAKLMIDHLSRSANRDEAFKRLEDVPQGLEMAYIIILSRLADQLDSRDLSFVKNILEVVVIARRPLRIEEARIAQALVSGEGSRYLERLDTRLEQKIFELCGGLIVIVNGHLHVIHFSLTELLTRHTKDWPHNSNKSHQFRISIDRVHQALGVGSLGYLGILDYGSPLLDANSFSELPRRHKFLDYASKHIIFHLRYADIAELAPNLIGLVLSRNCIPCMEYFFLVDLGTECGDLDVSPLTEKFNVLVKGQEMPEIDSLKTKWINAGRDFKIEVQQKIAVVGERSIYGAFLRLIADSFIDVPGWDILDNASNKSARFQIDDEDREDDSEIYFHAGGPDCDWISDNFSEASIQFEESQSLAIATMDTNIETTPKALWEGPSTAQPLLLPLLSRLQESPVIAVEEQARIFLQMMLSFEFMEELDTLAVFQSLVEQAAKFTPRALQLFGSAFDSNDSDHTFELYSIAYSRAQRHGIFWMHIVATELAELLNDQGKLAESEVLCRKMVSEFTEEYGGEHERTLGWLQSLSFCLLEQAKYMEAEAIMRTVWEICKRTWGENHRETLEIARRLSLCIEHGGESEALCRQVLDRREKHLGRNDADTVESYEDLLQHYLKKKDSRGTEKLYWEILNLQRLRLGDEHEDTRRAACDLVSYLEELAKYDMAEAVCLHLLKIERKILGDQEHDTLETVKCLRRCLRKQGKLASIEYLERTVFKSFRKFYSIGHNETLQAASRLVDTLFENGKDSEAENFLRRLLNIDQSILACDNCWRSSFAFDLGILLYRQEKWPEAEHAFRNLLTTLQKNAYEQESMSDIDNTIETHSGQGQGQGEDDEEDGYIDCFISHVLQELAYVLAQQGKEEEADAIKEELAIEEAAGRLPWLWEDID
jgi:tetratricopeptide (TPR) repeat protein